MAGYRAAPVRGAGGAFARRGRRGAAARAPGRRSAVGTEAEEEGRRRRRGRGAERRRLRPRHARGHRRARHHHRGHRVLDDRVDALGHRPAAQPEGDAAVDERHHRRADEGPQHHHGQRDDGRGHRHHRAALRQRAASTTISRGFEIDAYQYDGVPVPRDGTWQFGDNNADMILYDHVEIVRGATGLMQGAGEPGASINFIRKRPTSFLRREVAAAVAYPDRRPGGGRHLRAAQRERHGARPPARRRRRPRGHARPLLQGALRRLRRRSRSTSATRRCSTSASATRRPTPTTSPGAACRPGTATSR